MRSRSNRLSALLGTRSEIKKAKYAPGRNTTSARNFLIAITQKKLTD